MWELRLLWTGETVMTSPNAPENREAPVPTEEGPAYWWHESELHKSSCVATAAYSESRPVTVIEE